MTIVSRTGEARITNDSIRKHFRTTEPIDAVCELAWNGFDAKASTVSIELRRNAMDGLEQVTVRDDGEGIEYEKLDDLFGVFDDSAKKHTIDQRGANGRGRLAFHRVSHLATWFTKRPHGEARITVESATLGKYLLDEMSPPDSHTGVTSPTGTTVVLDRILPGVNLDESRALDHLSMTFGWSLALNPSRRLLFEGSQVPIPTHEYQEHSIAVGARSYKVKIVRWENKPYWEKSYIYVMSASGRTLLKELSKLNNKPDFYVSLN